MKKIPLYQVDAFGKGIFSGNPAAVCELDEWLPDEVMQKIAAENNLSETAFLVKDTTMYEIRWFTPKVEVDLCGHATLASAYVLFHFREPHSNKIVFSSKNSGLLSVEKSDGKLILDFPADNIVPCEPPKGLLDSFIPLPSECYKGISDYLLVFRKQSEVEFLDPNFEVLSEVDVRGVIVTAPGDKTDFVSRFFAPSQGILEDPVTGSAHTTLTVYWAKRLKKNSLTGEQLSKRKGYLQCTLAGDRVKIGGIAKLYLAGEIYIDD